MPQTIQYSNNPNSDTAFVVQDGGQKNRAVLTAEPAGTLQLSDSANVSTGYVTGEDGKKHKVNLVAQLNGNIEFSENPNSTKGYATVDGKKHRVVLTASLSGGGGSTPVIDELNVTPSTSAQTITAPSGVDGYSPVNVSAVDSTIDANITAGNIKKDVQILGVTGSYEGQTPTGTKSITANGVYDVTDFASADVQVPTTAPSWYLEKTIDAAGMLKSSTTAPLMDFSGITKIDAGALSYAYYKNTNISGTLNINNLTNLDKTRSLDNAFTGCTGLTSVNLSSLTTASGSYAITSCFIDCVGITNIDVSSLTNVTGPYSFNSTFVGCTGLTSVKFYSLTSISGLQSFQNAFQRCTNLTTLYFYSITPSSSISSGAISTMLSNVTGCTIHFPSNVTTKIQGTTGYPNFGGTSTSVLFDLPATVTLTGADSITYTRNPKYDTATALAWKVGAYGTTNFTPAYYTSGTIDPSTSNTIYSDSACTQAVTTISSIA